MPTWSGILTEIRDLSLKLRQEGHKKRSPFDMVRRKYLRALAQKTQKDTILYASKCTQPDPAVFPGAIVITDEDLQGLMEVVHKLKGPRLDLILHSPGGRLEAAEAFVTYLRSKFEHIRVIVPQIAMSAATMISCAADVIMLGKHSFLGPIDPQIPIDSPLGPRMVPAQAVKDQFERAMSDCKEDPSALAAWTPMLRQYGPDLLVQCDHVIELSRELVGDWLGTFMFKNDERGKQKAAQIASWLADHSHFKTHGRHIPREQLEQHGLRIEHLEDDQELQDLVLSVFHASTHSFSGTTAVKIIENHLGKAFINLRAVLAEQPAVQKQGPKPLE